LRLHSQDGAVLLPGHFGWGLLLREAQFPANSDDLSALYHFVLVRVELYKQRAVKHLK
jgi:hypothetical protein